MCRINPLSFVFEAVQQAFKTCVTISTRYPTESFRDVIYDYTQHRKFKRSSFMKNLRRYTSMYTERETERERRNIKS